MKYLVCTRNLEYVSTTNHPNRVGALVKYMMRWYKRSYIDIFKKK